MKEIKECPFCGTNGGKLIGTQTHKDKYLSLVDDRLNSFNRYWFKCNSCNFIFRSPMITEDEATIIYSKYRSLEFRKITPEDYFDNITSFPDDKSESYKKALFLKNNIDTEINSILDVGCGGGILLFQLKKLYPEAYFLGLEPNKDYADIVKGKLHIDVIGELYTPESVKESFDLTVSTDVLEHIHDISVFWESASKNIKLGKYLFIEVPSQNDFKVLDITHDVFEAPHLYFFSMEHVVKMAEEYSLKLVAYKNIIENSLGKSKDWFIFVKE